MNKEEKIKFKDYTGIKPNRFNLFRLRVNNWFFSKKLELVRWYHEKKNNFLFKKTKDIEKGEFLKNFIISFNKTFRKIMNDNRMRVSTYLVIDEYLNRRLNKEQQDYNKKLYNCIRKLNFFKRLLYGIDLKEYYKNQSKGDYLHGIDIVVARGIFQKPFCRLCTIGDYSKITKENENTDISTITINLQDKRNKDTYKDIKIK